MYKTNLFIFEDNFYRAVVTVHPAMWALVPQVLRHLTSLQSALAAITARYHVFIRVPTSCWAVVVLGTAREKTVKGCGTRASDGSRILSNRRIIGRYSFLPSAFQMWFPFCTEDISPIAWHNLFWHDPILFSVESFDHSLLCSQLEHTCNLPCDPRTTKPRSVTQRWQKTIWLWLSDWHTNYVTCEFFHLIPIQSPLLVTFQPQ